jgi:hypothetical protein
VGDTIHGVSGSVVFNQEGTLSLNVGGRIVDVPALVCRQEHLLQRCQLLLVGRARYHKARFGIERPLAHTGSTPRVSHGREEAAGVVGIPPR